MYFLNMLQMFNVSEQFNSFISYVKTYQYKHK
jgi:hypothetical protein